MLANKQLKAFVPTTRPNDAKIFYKDTLGLQLLCEDNYALQFEANGIELRVILVPALIPQEFTVLGWNVPDITETATALRKKGVHFEKYPTLEQNYLGIWASPNGSKVAWFKDPDGNVLSLTENRTVHGNPLHV